MKKELKEILELIFNDEFVEVGNNLLDDKVINTLIKEVESSNLSFHAIQLIRIMLQSWLKLIIDKNY